MTVNKESDVGKCSMHGDFNVINDSAKFKQFHLKLNHPRKSKLLVKLC